MRLNNMTGEVKLEDLCGTTVINGMVHPSCGYTIYFRSLQRTSYSFFLYFWRGLHKPSHGGARYCLEARLMDNITNSPSVRKPAPMNEFVGSFEIAEGYASETERKYRYLNELDFRISESQNGFSLKITGKTHKSIPDHLSNWEFEITIKLSCEMVQLLRDVPSLDHDA
jgi:hypothetical protein